MLGSLIRVLFFAGIVGAATWGVHRLTEGAGAVRIDVDGFEYALTPLAAAFGLFLAFPAFVGVFKAIGLAVAVQRFFVGGETAVGRFFNRRRERRGWEAMTRAMIALAEGDGGTAKARATKAEYLLKNHDLARLVTARAAEMIGDSAKARACYKALAEEKKTAYIGVRGLIELAQSAGNEDRALKLATQAHRLRPEDPWVLDTLYALQSRSFDWRGARKTLAEQRRAGFAPKAEADRRDATLALAQAEDAEECGRVEEARKLAVEAARLDPANADAVSTAARHLVAAGCERKAGRTIVQAWRIRPCPQLAAAYAAIKPDETPGERVKRFQTLLEANGAGAEPNLVRAELALTVGDWAGARRAIERIGEAEPSARSCAIMAAVARCEGEPDAVVRGWLARALGTPRDGAGGSVLDHAAMLPLLVGDPGEAVEDNGVSSDALGAQSER